MSIISDYDAVTRNQPLTVLFLLSAYVLKIAPSLIAIKISIENYDKPICAL